MAAPSRAPEPPSNRSITEAGCTELTSAPAHRDSRGCTFARGRIRWRRSRTGTTRAREFATAEIKAEGRPIRRWTAYDRALDPAMSLVAIVLPHRKGQQPAEQPCACTAATRRGRLMKQGHRPHRGPLTATSRHRSDLQSAESWGNV